MLPTMARMTHAGPESLSARLHARLLAAIAAAGGWLPFDRFMAMALYEPGLGYYARGSRQFGAMPASGSDFVTAPELSPLFGRALARQVAQALDAAQAGRGLRIRRRLGRAGGAIAGRAGRPCAALFDRRPVGHAARAAGRTPGGLGRPRALARRLARRAARRGAWATRCSTRCRCSCCTGTAQRWFERGVARARRRPSPGPTAPPTLRPPAAGPFVPGTVTEIHPQAEAFDPHAGRAPAARRRLLHRLRLPRGRVLPPAAQRRHADVPPRAPRRHRPAGRRRAPRTSPRMSTSAASRWPRRTPGWTCWATPRRRASC